MYKIPALNNLVLPDVPLVYGYYSLGLIEKYRPDVQILGLRLTRNDQWSGGDHCPFLLKDKIQEYLDADKIVFVVASDEYVMDANYDFSPALNEFADQPVYFVTEMDSAQSLYWTFQKNLKCKILELPFILVNDVLCYHHLRKKRQQNNQLSEYNFSCMINRPEKHKYDLCKMLLDLGLHKYGYISFTDADAPDWMHKHFVYNQLNDYNTVPLTEHRFEAGQILSNDILVSKNCMNYFTIESKYNTPLVVHPETVVGIFPNTEKSIWPALLGKMYLIYGHQGIIKWIQRFCDYGPERFSDLTYDSVEGYDDVDNMKRLETMLTRNSDLIRNAHAIYLDHKIALEQNKKTFVENLYSFFASQINRISA